MLRKRKYCVNGYHTLSLYTCFGLSGSIAQLTFIQKASTVLGDWDGEMKKTRTQYPVVEETHHGWIQYCPECCVLRDCVLDSEHTGLQKHRGGHFTWPQRMGMTCQKTDTWAELSHRSAPFSIFYYVLVWKPRSLQRVSLTSVSNELSYMISILKTLNKCLDSLNKRHFYYTCEWKPKMLITVKFKKTLQVGITVLNNKTFNSEKCSGLY